MHTSKTHRIYTILSKNLTFVGLTLDELGLGLSGLGVGILLLSEQKILYGTLCIVLGIVGVVMLKRFKKLSEGFSFKSALYAYGYWPKPSKNYPSFNIKVYGK